MEGEKLALSEQLLKLVAYACAEVQVTAADEEAGSERELVGLAELSDRLALVQSSLRRLRLLGARKLTGCFEWVDGPLVSAMQLGSWVLLSHAEQA